MEMFFEPVVTGGYRAGVPGAAVACASGATAPFAPTTHGALCTAALATAACLSFGTRRRRSRQPRRSAIYLYMDELRNSSAGMGLAMK